MMLNCVGEPRFPEARRKSVHQLRGRQSFCLSRQRLPSGRSFTYQPFRFARQTSLKAVAEVAKESATSLDPVQKGSWHAVVANADFMLHDVQNESFAEQLRERRRLFQEKEKPIDFWLVSEPAWLDEDFPKEAKKVQRPCVALVSTDEIWMNFMKLRLDRVIQLNLGEKSLNQITDSKGPVPDYEPLDRKGKWTAPYPPYRPGWWKIFMKE